ncbi:hypothetical protein LBO01_16660 [Companilactobacillus paralimentarius]|uniref:Transposase n=2 Tax=Companilactobacillus bobalius TaxID=2801451 RepID=A0A202FCL6_9LACO|nr:hypothetical protein LKACC16343_01081 [Companilactobacillus bobalius]GEO58537.1 hypothetical protein LBO01_16660 [Companilactobacillus paralimentarius]
MFEAYRGFFSKKRKFPRFKSKKFPKQSYQSKFVNNNVEIIDNSYIKLPKLGVMKYKNKKSIPSIIKYVTIRKSSTSKYYAVLTVDEEPEQLPKTNKSVGIDMVFLI